MRFAALAVLVLTLALPASALGATKYYVGKTEQGYKTSAKVVDGDLKWLKLKWWVDCKDEGYTIGPGTTKWVDAPEGPIEQTGTKFSDSGGGEAKLEKGHKVVWEELLSGEILSGGRIKGSEKVTARFYNSKGKQYDYCRGTIDFSLKRR